jgi:hypothetical protein
VQKVALCKGSGVLSKGTLIHSLTERKDTFLQHPSFASGDTPPLTIPAAQEHYANFAIATVICPATDLYLAGDPAATPTPIPAVENTLSIWAMGRGTINVELLVVEIHDANGAPPS